MSFELFFHAKLESNDCYHCKASVERLDKGDDNLSSPEFGGKSTKSGLDILLSYRGRNTPEQELECENPDHLHGSDAIEADLC